MSAYDIVRRSAVDGQRIAPTQVYRALARLIAQGAVYRVESRAAYLLQGAPCDLCLICERCTAVTLLSEPHLAAALGEQSRRLGFAPNRVIIEVIGLCMECMPLTDPRRCAEPAPLAKAHALP